MYMNVMLLNDLVKFVNGNGFALQYQNALDGEIPFIKVSDMNNKGNEKYILYSNNYVTRPTAIANKWNIIPKGSIVFAKIGAAIYLNRTRVLAYDSIIDNNMMAAVPQMNVTSEYLYLLFCNVDYSRYINTGFPPSLNLGLMRNIKLEIHDDDTQVQLANVFMTWDQGIEKLDKLIVAKQMFRKTLLQKLLNGLIRFPGFGKPVPCKDQLPKGWKSWTLSQIATIIVSNVDKKTYVSESAVQLCNYLDVYKNRYLGNDIVFMRASATDEEIRKFKVKRLDILITKDSESPNDIGIPAIIMEDLHNVVCGYHLAIIRCNPEIVTPLYIFMAFNNTLIKDQWKKLANGVTRFGLAVGDIEKVSVLIPEDREQIKIASCLFYLDKEITCLISTKIKLNKQREGLLSVLFGKEKNTIGGINGKN